MQNPDDASALALSFTRHLADRAYGDAYALTSSDYQASVTLEELQSEFEAMIPLDWGAAEPIEVVQTMLDWPGRSASDLLWVYVSIGGDVYSEGLTAIVTSEGDAARIREVEFGRP